MMKRYQYEETADDVTVVKTEVPVEAKLSPRQRKRVEQIKAEIEVLKKRLAEVLGVAVS